MVKFIVTIVVFIASVSACCAKPTDQIRVLMITGVDHPAHHWMMTAPAIREILSHDERFEVRIVEMPEVLATDLIFDFDLLFLHFKNNDALAREDVARANLARFVREGGGLTVLHFACGAFEDWPEYGELAGRVWDRKNSHDPRGPFMVEIADAEHVITTDMEDFPTDDELYICLMGERPITVLATAQSKVTGKQHPMAFVLEYGKGRVFHSSLGHDARAIQTPGTARLIRRGCAWAASRKPLWVPLKTEPSEGIR